MLLIIKEPAVICHQDFVVFVVRNKVKFVSDIECHFRARLVPFFIYELIGDNGEMPFFMFLSVLFLKTLSVLLWGWCGLKSGQIKPVMVFVKRQMSDRMEGVFVLFSFVSLQVMSNQNEPFVCHYYCIVSQNICVVDDFFAAALCAEGKHKPGFFAFGFFNGFSVQQALCIGVFMITNRIVVQIHQPDQPVILQINRGGLAVFIQRCGERDIVQPGVCLIPAGGDGGELCLDFFFIRVIRAFGDIEKR